MKEIKYYTLYMLERAKHDILKDKVARELLDRQLDILDQKEIMQEQEQEIKILKHELKELKKGNK